MPHHHSNTLSLASLFVDLSYVNVSLVVIITMIMITTRAGAPYCPYFMLFVTKPAEVEVSILDNLLKSYVTYLSESTGDNLILLEIQFWFCLQNLVQLISFFLTNLSHKFLIFCWLFCCLRLIHIF